MHGELQRAVCFDYMPKMSRRLDEQLLAHWFQCVRAHQRMCPDIR